MASSSGCAPEGGARSSPVVVEKGASVSPSEQRKTDQRFPRCCRLTARRQFKKVYSAGWKTSCPSFAIFGLPNDVGRCRLGLTVTRKVGNAVDRNRMKRILRTIFRRNRERLSGSLDLVVNARRSLLGRSALQLEREFVGGVLELARRRER